MKFGEFCANSGALISASLTIIRRGMYKKSSFYYANVGRIICGNMKVNRVGVIRALSQTNLFLRNLPKISFLERFRRFSFDVAARSPKWKISLSQIRLFNKEKVIFLTEASGRRWKIVSYISLALDFESNWVEKQQRQENVVKLQNTAFRGIKSNVLARPAV